MSAHKILSIAWLWVLALALSALLAAAGARWSAPLPIRGDLVGALLLLPPLATALAVLRRWSLPVEGTESSRPSEETQA
jgi:hypothetical protein